MKLSEAQKRVLEIMNRHNCYAYIARWHTFYGFANRQSATPDEVWRFPPPARTVRALKRKGLLQSEGHEGWTPHYVLTPKGREEAKELEGQDAKTE